MSSDDRNNTEKQRDKILEKYGLRYTSADELSDVAADMADDAKILKELASKLSEDDDDREEEDDDDRDN
jgi:hypothetical protein